MATDTAARAEFEAATLATIADGKLEERFQEILTDIRANIISQLDEFETDAAGAVKCKVKASIEFCIGDDGKSINVIVGADLAWPAHRKSSNTVFARRDGFVVWANEPKQEPLPFVRPVKAGNATE